MHVCNSMFSMTLRPIDSGVTFQVGFLALPWDFSLAEDGNMKFVCISFNFILCFALYGGGPFTLLTLG